MTTKILYLFTRTPLHVGAGSSVGAIDQPVIRERHTGFPIIPGSGIKGVLRDYCCRNEVMKPAVDKLFGLQDNAGHLSFGEAKLLLFPLRSARGSYALATCPLALSRYARDKKLQLEIPSVSKDSACLAGKGVQLPRGNSQAVALEEYVFDSEGEFPTAWVTELTSLLNDAVLSGAKDRFVLLSDGDFSHFTVNACQISQHIRIDHDTGTVADGALFNTETVPSEALFYSPITSLRDSGDNEVFQHLGEERLLQFGGDGTTGLGFCTVKLS